ncbi:MAG: hypothetical protein V9G04_08895 [Nocardioides sp.]|jgi:hypothetical protein
MDETQTALALNALVASVRTSEQRALADQLVAEGQEAFVIKMGLGRAIRNGIEVPRDLFDAALEHCDPVLLADLGEGLKAVRITEPLAS